MPSDLLDIRPRPRGRQVVLFAIPTLEGGGAERVVTHLLRGLPPERYDLHLALQQAVGPFLAQVPPTVTLHDLQVRRARHAAAPLLRLIWTLRPDVIMPCLFPLNAVLLSLAHLMPAESHLVLRESAGVADVISPKASATRRGLWLALLYTLYRRAPVIVCPARAMADDLVRRTGLPRERITVIPNPVDVGAMNGRGDDSTSPYTGEGPHLVAMGRLVAQKGFDRLLRLFRRVRPESAQLWILGSGELERPLRAAAESLGLGARVRFPGFSSEASRWLRHADLFVQCSRFEGCPNALLEALACGTRAVAFDSPGGTREVLEGVEGTALIPDGDEAAFVAAVDRMLAPDRPARPALPARHALESVIAQYDQLLTSVVRRTASTAEAPARQAG